MCNATFKAKKYLLQTCQNNPYKTSVSHLYTLEFFNRFLRHERTCSNEGNTPYNRKKEDGGVGAETASSSVNHDNSQHNIDDDQDLGAESPNDLHDVYSYTANPQ